MFCIFIYFKKLLSYYYTQHIIANVSACKQTLTLKLKTK